MKMKKSVLIAAPFPVELDHRARVTAATLSISKSELIRRAVREYIEQCSHAANKASIDIKNG